jgi:hypothetical protein
MPEDECSICWDAIQDPSVQLACKHKYHYDCITEWAKRNTACPMCRQTFTDAPPAQPWVEHDIDANMSSAHLFSAVLSSITALRIIALFYPNFVENLFASQIKVGRLLVGVWNRWQHVAPTVIAMLFIVSIH